MTLSRSRRLAALAAIGLAAVPAGIAQAGDGHGGHHGAKPTHTVPALQIPDAPPPPAPAPVDAQTFVTNATQSNVFEIVSSRVALRHTRNPVVRGIAEMLIADHTTQQGQLQTVARQLGLTVPPLTPSPEQSAVVASLRERYGASFDAAYLQAQVAAHEQAITLFLGTAANAANPEPLRTLAIGALPILGRHLGEVTATLDGGHEGH
jgi:putative membrane protein